MAVTEKVYAENITIYINKIKHKSYFDKLVINLVYT